MYRKYDIVSLGVPNVKLNDNPFYDSEDFIYCHLILPQDYSIIIAESYISDEHKDDIEMQNHMELINYSNSYSNSIITLESVYEKIKYIYQYVKYYYSNDLKHLSPNERLAFLPNDMLYWIDNIVCILRNVLDTEKLHSFSFREVKTIRTDYFDELLYGLNLCVCHLKMIINHHIYNQSRTIQMCSMCDKYTKQLFKILNNMCVIVLFMRLDLDF